MTHNYTSNQIIKYLYNELPALEHLETEYAIEHNPVWKESYRKLKDAYSALPRVSFFPKKKAINSILKYSQLTS